MAGGIGSGAVHQQPSASGGRSRFCVLAAGSQECRARLRRSSISITTLSRDANPGFFVCRRSSFNELRSPLLISLRPPAQAKVLRCFASRASRRKGVRVRRIAAGAKARKSLEQSIRWRRNAASLACRCRRAKCGTGIGRKTPVGNRKGPGYCQTPRTSGIRRG